MNPQLVVRCPDVVDEASDRFDGDLSDPRAAEYDAHLEACPPCREFYRTFALTVERARDVLRVTPPEDIAQTLVEGFREQLRRGA